MSQQHPVQVQLGMPALSSLSYDDGAYRADLRQSVGPGQYVLASVAPNCHPCMSQDARLIQGTTGGSLCASRSLVDVESDLHNLSRKATHSPAGLYRGDGGPPITCGPGGATPFPSCDGLAAVDTRLSNPPCTLRGTGWNRFEWLCRNPQENAIASFNTNVDTSIVVKDNHRPLVARPVDPTLALPPGKRDADASVGAPQWIPQGACAGGVGAVDEPPNLLWRSCAEVSQITNGCRVTG